MTTIVTTYCTAHGPLCLGLSADCTGPAAERVRAVRAAAGLDPSTGRDSLTPTPVTMAREHIGAVHRPAPGEPPETDRLRCIAAGVTFERTRLSARLRARISVLRASPILSEEVDGASAALEQVLAELGG